MNCMALENMCVKMVSINAIVLQAYSDIIAVPVPGSRRRPSMKGNLIILLALIYS